LGDELTSAREDGMNSEEAKAMVRRWILGIWDRCELGLLDELASTAYSYSAPGHSDLRGEAFKALVREMHSGFPDKHNTIEDQIAEGNKVVTRGTTYGTHLGPFGGIAPSGCGIAVPWVIITEFAGDRIASDWEIDDALGVMQQLGVTT
jgi:predicted ester cyclase